jgi:hypothetical protein
MTTLSPILSRLIIIRARRDALIGAEGAGLASLLTYSGAVPSAAIILAYEAAYRVAIQQQRRAA